MIIDLKQDGVTEGSINVSGTTVSYNTFTGSHFAQWGTGCEPDEEPLPGTLLSTVDEPYERWYFDEDRVRADSDGATDIPGGCRPSYRDRTRRAGRLSDDAPKRTDHPAAIFDFKNPRTLSAHKEEGI